MELKIRFNTRGSVTQHVNITKEGVTPEQIQHWLGNGTAVTSLNSDLVTMAETGEILGKVVNSDCDCYYSDFDVRSGGESTNAD